MMEIQEILTTILMLIGSQHQVLGRWNRNFLKTSEHLLNDKMDILYAPLHRRFIHRCHEVVTFLTDDVFVVCVMNGYI
jgi:hypothetical protein